MKRYIMNEVLKDLKKKMVFIGGPRQVGKTTLAKSLLSDHFSKGIYLNWDFDENRRDIIKKKWQEEDKVIIFDELHKYPKWKSWIKGIYDVVGDKHSIIVTGSARLDVYRRGGDSLMGRYHYWRLHPFSLDEIPSGISSKDALKRLMTVGGFPESFMSGNEKEARRWRRERYDRILKEDIRDLESIQNIQLLNLFLDLLRQRVSSLITLTNIANDIQIAAKTAKAWLELLERMYLIFIVRPYTKSLPRAIQKPPKVYFFDNGDVIGDEGAIFENLVAAALIKKLHFLEDRDGYRYELKYIRDKEGREVDFAIVKDNQLEEIIEVKYGDESISKSLVYYAQKLMPKKATQIVANLRRPYDMNNIKVIDPISYFKQM